MDFLGWPVLHIQVSLYNLEVVIWDISSGEEGYCIKEYGLRHLKRQKCLIEAGYLAYGYKTEKFLPALQQEYPSQQRF